MQFHEILPELWCYPDEIIYLKKITYDHKCMKIRTQIFLHQIVGHDCRSVSAFCSFALVFLSVGPTIIIKPTLDTYGYISIS